MYFSEKMKNIINPLENRQPDKVKSLEYCRREWMCSEPGAILATMATNVTAVDDRLAVNAAR